MLTIAIVATLGLFIGLSDEHERAWNGFQGIFWGGVVGVFIALLIGVPSSPNMESEQVVVEEYGLVALNDAVTVSSHGNFFLVVGNYSSSTRFEYIYYYEDLDTGAIRLGKQDAEKSNVAVFEENREDALLIITATRKYWSVDSMLGLWSFHLKTEGENIRDRQYGFHVPEGTVKRDISLDLDK